MKNNLWLIIVIIIITAVSLALKYFDLMILKFIFN